MTRAELVEKMAYAVWHSEQHVGMFNPKLESILMCRSEKMLQVVLANIGHVTEPCKLCYGHGFNPEDVIDICPQCIGHGVTLKDDFKEKK